MNHQSKLLLRAVCSLAVIATAACSATTETDAALNACAMLEEGEIMAAVGSDVSPGERDDAGLITEGPEAGTYSSTCVWRVLDGDSSDASGSLQDADYIILNAMRWPAGKTPERFLQAFRDLAAQGVLPQRPIALDIGDSALWWGDGVAVIKDQTSFGVSARLIGERGKRRQVEEMLAARIVSDW